MYTVQEKLVTKLKNAKNKQTEATSVVKLLAFIVTYTFCQNTRQYSSNCCVANV